MSDLSAVVLDTNVFVAAGFNPRSSSARILEQVRRGQLRMIWNEASRRETECVLNKIPPLSNEPVADLFRDGDRFDGPTEPEKFADVPDPDDRKFAALCAATGATLVTADNHLLAGRERQPIRVFTPAEFWRQFGEHEGEKSRERETRRDSSPSELKARR